MTNTESKIPEPDFLLTYSKAAIKKALSKYSFKFTVDGVDCRVWQDPDDNTYRYFDCGNAAELFSELTAQIVLKLSKRVSIVSHDIPLQCNQLNLPCQ